MLDKIDARLMRMLTRKAYLIEEPETTLRADIGADKPLASLQAASCMCRVEWLCRYITRPAIANERLSRNSKGEVVLQRKTSYRDGTPQIAMSALEFHATRWLRGYRARAYTLSASTAYRSLAGAIACESGKNSV